MADTSTTKQKTAAKKPTSVPTPEELRKQLAAKQDDLLAAKRSHKAGELVNPRVLTTTRKEIARLHTAITSLQVKESE